MPKNTSCPWLQSSSKRSLNSLLAPPDPMPTTLHCPICRKEVALDSPDVPFCSDRCRLIDLGKWASGDYKIASPILDPDLLEELEAGELQAELRARTGRERSEN